MAKIRAEIEAGAQRPADTVLVERASIHFGHDPEEVDADGQIAFHEIGLGETEVELRLIAGDGDGRPQILAVIVGFAAASGLGFQFRLDMSFFRYTDVMLLLMVYVLLVWAVDLLSTGLRRLAR